MGIMNKELAEYLFLCVTFHHDFDESYKITPDATDKEIEMYKKSIDYLKEIINEYKRLEEHIVLTEEEQEFFDKCKALKKGTVKELQISRLEIEIRFADTIINGCVFDGHTWTFPQPSDDLIYKMRNFFNEW